MPDSKKLTQLMRQLSAQLDHFITSGILILGCLLSTFAIADGAKLPVADFFSAPQFRDARFSPDGKSLAMRMPGTNGRVSLYVMEIGKMQPEMIANYEDKDVRSFYWVNNERLIYDLNDLQFKENSTFFGPGLYAVNKDRTNRLRLVTHRYSGPGEIVSGSALAWYTFFVDIAHGSATPDIYVAQSITADSDIYDLYRLNTLTGNTERIRRPGKVSKWLMDKTGVPRVVQTIDGPTAHLHYNDPKTKEWRQITSSSWTSYNNIDPVFISPEGDLYVKTTHGNESQALYRFNLETNALDPEPVISLKGYDFNGSLIYSSQQKKTLGLRYEMREMSTIWFDPALTEQQKKIDAMFPSTVNLLTFSDNPLNPVALVHSFSDVQPGIWHLYELKTGKLLRLGTVKPTIDPETMSPKTMVRYTARDGLEIPASLTLPRDSQQKNLPLVVLVHGGPYVRGGHWNWDGQVQFLASRGYAVLEPDFRGSTGYGEKHFRAGMKQWGLAMQDDIADGAQWAIAQGYADAKRICIAGASYGGYATLMGLIKNPELFRCGIDWVGVSDINLLYNNRFSDLSDEWKRYGMPVLIGDQTTDAAQLKTTSPLENANRLNQPLLMAYGKKDHRVPIEHGKKFYQAVKEHNPQVEWVEYAEEGHGFHLLKNNIDFWTRVENFLQKNIGTP